MFKITHNDRRSRWSRVVIVGAVLAAGWGEKARAEINVTGPGNRRIVFVPPKKGNPSLPYFQWRKRPFHTTETFQTLDAEPSTGGGSSPGNIIHPDPDDPSSKVSLDVTQDSATLEAGESVELTVRATFTGTPTESVWIYHGPIPEGLGITHSFPDGRRPNPSARNKRLRINTTTTVPPGSYQFYVMGLTSENKYTAPAEYLLIVEPPSIPPPPATTNSGVVEVINTYYSVILEGAYELDGDLQQVGALFDNENDHIVNAMPVGNNSFPFPRWTNFVGLSAWRIDPGRGYAGNGLLTANVVVSAVVNVNYFVSAHLHVSNTGVVTPILLTAGDLTNQAGVVMSADAFEVQVEGATPTATQDGFIRGAVEGVVLFLEDENTLWSDGITFTFDVPLYND